MKRVMTVVAMAAVLLARCQECPAQMLLSSAPQEAEVTLTNTTPVLVLSNCTSSIGRPGLLSIANLGAGAVEYNLGRTTGVWRPLLPGVIIGYGRDSMFDLTLWMRLRGDTNSVVRAHRDVERK